MVCGIVGAVFSTVLGFFFITLPLGFILGVVAIVLGTMGVRRAREAAIGRGQAIAGIVTGAIAVVATIFWGFAFGALFAGFEDMFEDPDALMEELEGLDDVEELEELEE